MPGTIVDVDGCRSEQNKVLKLKGDTEKKQLNVYIYAV